MMSELRKYLRENQILLEVETDPQFNRNVVRNITNKAVRRGIIKKRPCEHCGAKKVDCHHVDYDQPFVVLWLCRRCHWIEHVRLDRLTNHVS